MIAIVQSFLCVRVHTSALTQTQPTCTTCTLAIPTGIYICTYYTHVHVHCIPIYTYIQVECHAHECVCMRAKATSTCTCTHYIHTQIHVHVHDKINIQELSKVKHPRQQPFKEKLLPWV